MIENRETFCINVVKVSYDDKPSHWEVETYLHGEEIGAGTGPKFEGMVDLALELIEEYNSEWIKFDGNKA